MRFTDLVGCTRPVQLAGMGGGLSDVALAAAVSNAGGLGMLGGGGLPAEALVASLDELTAATDGPFGVNFLVPFVDPGAVRAAAARCRVCDFHFGTPDADLVAIVRDAGAVAGWQVGDVEEAKQAADAGCAFVIAQGVEAGGHVRGTTPLADLLGSLTGALDIPIVASGGIGSAQDVRDAIDAGASAVRIGTRFLAATESAAHPDYVQALIDASATDTELTEAFGADWPNAPHRVLRSAIAAATNAPADVVATLGEGDHAFPISRFSSLPAHREVRGNIAAMALYAGTSVGHVTQRETAAAICEELCSLL